MPAPKPNVSAAAGRRLRLQGTRKTPEVFCFWNIGRASEPNRFGADVFLASLFTDNSQRGTAMLNFSGRRLPALAQYSKREAASVITNFRLTALRMAASAKRSLGGKSSAASVESRDRQERRARLQENIREVQQRRADQSRGRQERGAGLQEDIPAAELARKGGHPLPEPTGIAKQVLDAGRKRRGEIAIEPELPPADSLTAEILAAGRKRRGETTIQPNCRRLTV